MPSLANYICLPSPNPNTSKEETNGVGRGNAYAKWNLKRKQLKVYLGSSVPPILVTLLISILQPSS